MYYNKIWGGEMYYVFNYGERLRQLRRERGFTQEEVALRADITTSYYGQLERGTANPSVAMLEKICAVMGISICDIFTEDNTNLLGIDPLSMQIIHQLNGKSDEEKELILSLIKTAFRLQNKKSENFTKNS
ncbi:MAG: helix-turn-helix transcriptional regulator [Oscillospiraceae bacterium]|nr:helix-turn-helix transcriptional regulator [Oscillospiraceae bacterium]